MESLKTHQNINFLLDGILDLITDSVLGALEVIPGVTVVVHEGEEVVIQPDQLEVLALHIGNFHVVCGGTDILKLLSCKQNIKSCLHPNIAKDPPVKMSRATRWTLAWPCFPVFEVDISTILHGRF